MAVTVETFREYKPSYFEVILHYYRSFITFIVFGYRKMRGTPIFAPKSFLHSFFDFTLFDKQTMAFYAKYPMTINSIIDPEITNELFKNHRSDPNSIFKGNNVMNRFLEIIQIMYPESNIQANDCILTCDEFHTKIYHKFIYKYLSQKTIEERKEVINQNIISKFSNLDGCTIDLYDIINNFVCDNFTTMFFGNTYTQEETSFSNCCSKISEYIHHNRMNTIMSKKLFNDELYDDNLHNMKATIEVFKNIINKIIDENKQLFDEENFTISQRQAFVPIILFAGQETTNVLATYVIYTLGKIKDLIKEGRPTFKNDEQKLNKVIDNIFNHSLASCTPAHGIARILRYNTKITSTDGTSKIYKENTVIGPMPCHIAKRNFKSSVIDYNVFIPFGKGKHRCPGEHLVLMEIKELIKYLICNYDIETNANKINFVQHMTQKITTKFLTTFHKVTE